MSETERVKQRRKKKTVQELLKSKRRDQRKKGQRLARRALSEMVARRVANQRTYANVVAVRRDPGGADPHILLGMRTGLFGHPTTTVLKVEDERIVGAVEDVKELGEIVTQVGLLTLAALVNYNLAWGPEGLAKALARWANIDLSELEKKAEEAAMQEVLAGIEATKAEEEGQAAIEGADAIDDHSDCECTGADPMGLLEDTDDTHVEQPEAPAADDKP